jgi:hypothetical protein
MATRFLLRKVLNKLEATGGFEPPNRGFADPRLNLLATSPYVLLFYSKIKSDAINIENRIGQKAIPLPLLPSPT